MAHADEKRRCVQSAEAVQEHILVCLSSAPSNSKIVRTGARMAEAFRGKLTALFVKTPDFDAMTPENRRRLRENTALAEQLGASVETTYGEDVSYQIAEFARLSGVTKIVIGRSNVRRRHPWSKPTLTEKLTEIAPNLDIHIIPDSAVQGNRSPHSRRLTWSLTPADFGKTLGILLLATAIGLVFYNLGFTEANIITVYLLGMLLISIFTTGWVCNLLASIVSVLVFNYLFTVPRFAMVAYDKGYPVTFVIMFSASIITGTLAAKLKNHARESARSAYRSQVLFEANQLLQKAEAEADIFQVAGSQLSKLLRRTVLVYPAQGAQLGEKQVFDTREEDTGWMAGPREQEAARWTFQHNKRSGATTEVLPKARGLYLAIRAGENACGVVGIHIGDRPLEAFEYSMVLSVLGECALAMENKRNAREKEQAALLAQSEQLRANLLRSISHDLRTPLTSISGNASNLMSNGDSIDREARQQIYTDIYDDSLWLINLVENLLAVTRIENGQMQLRTSVQLMDEIITEALRHTGRREKDHHIRLKECSELLLVRADSRLIVQVIINLMDNALKYTPPGSTICISSEKIGTMAAVHIVDDGPGIPDAQKDKVFEMFYTGSSGVADSRRSIGLGLSLCRSIILAHGGSLTLADNVPQGCRFTFTIPLGEVDIHE
ncbi:MAG: DUF4118 domain-containing protein [Eubacteriales bacterium]|nr:DUF4118 domain-containing protein [Eubacteriales bacterium]